MYSHVACDVMKERTLYLLKPSSLIWHLMPYLFLYTINISVDLAHHKISRAKVGKGGINMINSTEQRIMCILKEYQVNLLSYQILS